MNKSTIDFIVSALLFVGAVVMGTTGEDSPIELAGIIISAIGCGVWLTLGFIELDERRAGDE